MPKFSIKTREIAQEYFKRRHNSCSCLEPVGYPDLILGETAVQYHGLGQICLHDGPVFSVLDLIDKTIEANPTKAEVDSAEYILAILNARLRLHEKLDGHRHIISLGETCLPKTLPTKWGLKASRSMGEKTMPFDLSIHPLQAVLNILNEDFASYLDKGKFEYDETLGYVADLGRGIHWNHESGPAWSEDGFEKFKLVYARRIANLQAAASGPVLWFACTDCQASDAAIERLCEILLRRYPEAIGSLALLSTDKSRPAGLVPSPGFTLPVARFNLPLPFEGYRWWSYEDFSTQQGRWWEESIARWLEELVVCDATSRPVAEQKDEPATIGLSLDQQAERAIADYVLSGRPFEPEPTLRALRPIADVPHPQQPWAWKCIAESALAVDDIDLFLEFSRRFILSDSTHRADYRIGKLGMMYDCIRHLHTRGLPVEDELQELHALSPSQFDLDQIASLGVDVELGQNRTFDDEGPVQVLPASEERRPVTSFFLAPHFAAAARQPAAMTVRVVTDVDYMAVGADTALIRPDGRLYRHLSRSPAVRQAWEDAKRSGRRRAPGGTTVILNDIFTLSNYCHWMLDWLPRLLAAQEFVGSIDYVCTRHAAKPFEIETLCVVAGLRQDQILLDCERETLHFDRAVLIDNHRIADTHAIWAGNAHVIDLLRQRVFATAGGRLALRQKRRVYLSRKDAGSRLVLNEDALTDVFSRHGVEVVSISGLSVVDQARLFCECELVVGVHGAGLANIAFMPSGGSVLELFHYQFGSEAYATLAHGCRHHYGYLSCDSVPGSRQPIERPAVQKAVRYQYSDIWVEPAQLDQALAALCPTPRP